MALLLCTVPASAQPAEPPPPDSEVRRLLESADLKAQAWGAYWVGRLSRVDSADAVARIAARQIGQPWPAAVTLDIALDALIEIGVTPGRALVEKLRRERPAQALIFLARMGADGGPVLLSMLDDTKGYEWTAAANLLYERKASGFAARLVRPLTFTAHVMVSTSGDRGVGAGALGFTVGDGAGSRAEGYPPWTGYALRGCDQTGEVLIAPGVKPVCFIRQRTSAGSTGFLATHAPSGPTDTDRLRYLRQIYPDIALSEDIAVAWKGEAQLAADMAQQVRIIRAKYQTLLAKLLERGWITPVESEALASPNIRELVTDLRPK